MSCLNHPRFKFLKKNRILSSNIFKDMLKTKPKFYGGCLRVYYAEKFSENNNLNNNNINKPEIINLNIAEHHHFSFGLIVPKRYVKRAADRNLIKRHLRENFRLNLKPSLESKAKSNAKSAELNTLNNLNEFKNHLLIFFYHKPFKKQNKNQHIEALKKDLSTLNQIICKALPKI